MKLREANKEDNRRFHELPVDERTDTLESWYSQVFATDTSSQGEFTPAALETESVVGKPKRDDRDNKATLRDTANKLNFLMNRFNMAGDSQFENRVKELALLRFEYQLLTGDTDFTQDPKLVADFFTKRGKPELIRSVLERMGEQAVGYEHLAKKIIDHPVFAEHLGSDAVAYKFRSRLHVLIEDDDYSKEQAAAALMHEGFDLMECDFNRWFKTESDFSIKIGDKQYKVSSKETAWLTKFVSEHAEEQQNDEQVSDETALIPVDADQDDEPEQKFSCSKEGIEALDASVQHTLSEKRDDPTAYWVKELAALTADHSELTLDSANLVEAKMWDYLWGGQFNDLAHQLKGANPYGKTRKGLNYCRWALTHEEHRKDIDPILAQNSLAMIVAGDLLVGDLEKAKEDLSDPGLQEYRNADKIKAAVNLAWEMLQHPGESDEQEEYEPPKAYLFQIASDFGDVLSDMPSAAPYLKLASAELEKGLGQKESAILGAITSFDTVERIYTQLGITEKIKDRFLDILDEIYDDDTEYMILRSEVRGTVFAIQHPTFRKYVDDEAIGARLCGAVERTLNRKNEYHPDKQEPGASKMVLTLYQNSVLQPYLDGRIDIGEMANGMIDDVIGRDGDLLTTPCSLRHQGELTMDTSEVIEAYMIADQLREHIDPERMQRLVAYLLALNSEMTVSNSFNLTSFVIDKVGEQADPTYQRPDYFPDGDSDKREQRVEFLSNVFEREKELGGLDWQTASTGVTNVIFRGTYVQPNRFYPRLDTMMGFLDSSIADLLPSEGLGYDAVKEYKILREFLKN